MGNTPYVIGRTAERIAELDYRERGYEVVARNYRCHVGEIDLLLFGHGELVVAEVKGRRWLRFDDAWLTRWYRKKSRLSRTLRWFLTEHREWLHRAEGFRLEIVFVTQGRVTERYEDEPYRG
jgi:putative endonuclease